MSLLASLGLFVRGESIVSHRTHQQTARTPLDLAGFFTLKKIHLIQSQAKLL